MPTPLNGKAESRAMEVQVGTQTRKLSSSVQAKPRLVLLLTAYLWPVGIATLVFGDACVPVTLEVHFFVLSCLALLALLGMAPAFFAYRVGVGQRKTLAGVALLLNAILGASMLFILGDFILGLRAFGEG